MGRWGSPSSDDYFDEFGPRIVRCERCRREPVSLPEFDVLCESCRRDDAAKAIRDQRAIERTKGAA